MIDSIKVSFFVNESFDSSLNILAFDSSSRDPDICSKYN